MPVVAIIYQEIEILPKVIKDNEKIYMFVTKVESQIGMAILSWMLTVGQNLPLKE